MERTKKFELNLNIEFGRVALLTITLAGIILESVV